MAAGRLPALATAAPPCLAEAAASPGVRLRPARAEEARSRLGPAAVSCVATAAAAASLRRCRAAARLLRAPGPTSRVARQQSREASSSSGGSDDSLYNAGLDSLLAEARNLMDAQGWVADVLAAARKNAQAGWQQGRAPAPPAPTNMGLEGAPEEVRRELEVAFCGSLPYPEDAQVEALWRSMSGGAEQNASGSDYQPPLSLGAWSPWRLRAVGAGALQAALLGAGLARDNRAAAYAAEALERWSALSTCLAAGVLQRGRPAAVELLMQRELTVSGRRVEAYVTHLTDDDYILGASVLAASLAATGTTRPLLAMVTDGVSAEGRGVLHAAGWAILDVDLVGFADKDSQHIRGYFCKILLWGLPCHSVIYLDTDTIVMDNLDGLFAAAKGNELAAVPDSQPHQSGEMVVQAGCMVVEPSPERFADLWDTVCGSRRPESLDSWKQHEQGFLTDYFDGDRGVNACGPGESRPQWQILPAQYNFNVRYHLRPLYNGITPENASLVHFACCKPWDPKQRHFSPPAYVELFLEFARALGLPWRPGNCAMDELREQEQQRKMQQIMAERERQ